MPNEAEEEILESLWVLREEQLNTYDRLIEYSNLQDPESAVDGLVRSGFLARQGDRVVFTKAGERAGAIVTRRHRLAERLLADVLQVQDNRLLESTACDLEHALNPDVAESVCTLLGHPPLCPHNRRIPPGDCCRRDEREVKPLTVRLTELDVGRSGKVTFILPGSRRRLEHLLSLGIAPGCMVKLVQKLPAYVITVGETTLAIDGDIAAEIYVRPAPRPALE